MTDTVAPYATADAGVAAEDGVPIELNVLANDVGQGLVLIGVDVSGLQGALSWRPEGLITYDPDTAFQHLAVGQSADTTFTYTLQDAAGLTSTALVTMTVWGYNDRPVAVTDDAEVAEKGTVTLDVLANDFDVDVGDGLTLISVSETASGSSVAIVDGKIVYTADADSFDPLEAGDFGADTFTYVAGGSEGGGGGGLSLQGTNKPDKLCGGAFDDLIDGGNSDDTLCGEAGGDWLYGNNGSDRLYGGRGFDRLFGENGTDTLWGEDGDDRLDGGNGNDQMFGGAGGDLLEGRNGNDLLNGGEGDDWLEGGLGNDRFVFKGAFGSDMVFDFDLKNDVIELDKSVVNSFAAVKAHAVQDGSDVLITLGDHAITLSGVQLSQLKADDFVFTS
jgi:VCBS repeat-containing protein